jgi:hypothetical protein
MAVMDFKRRSSSVKVTEETINDLIRKRAYEIYEKKGTRDGDALADWIQAEREVKKMYQR